MITEPVNWMAIGEKLFLLVLGILTAFNTWRSGRRDARVEEIHKATNSMKDALVESTKIGSHAIGMAEGIARQKAEQKAQNK
jgi:hypothetical protein